MGGGVYTRCVEFSIGQLAATTGESVKTLRYWTDLGLLPAARGRNRYRRYRPDSAERAAAIRRAQALGLSLAEVARLLSARDGSHDESRVELSARLAGVREQIALLQALEATLTERLEWAERHAEVACAVRAGT